jgi:Protein of unknown function (DUF2892)
MTKNMGTIDRALRVVIGLVLLAYALKVIGAGSSWSWIGWIGVVPLLTALIGNCPAYSIFGINTCGITKR